MNVNKAGRSLTECFDLSICSHGTAKNYEIPRSEYFISEPSFGRKT
jgi:hypothetical protein